MLIEKREHLLFESKTYYNMSKEAGVVLYLF